MEKTARGGTAGPIRLGSGVRLKTLAVRPLGLEPLFDGESLDGWTVIPHPSLPEERRTDWSAEAA